MNKFRRFLALMVVLCLGLCLAACGGGSANGGTTSGTEGSSSSTTESTDDGKVDYKVTVLYPDGTPAVGVAVQVCMDDLCYSPATTDENGVATFRLTQIDGYKTKLAVAVEGYVWDDYIYFAFGETEITINLVAESDGKVDYKVNVVYPDGTPVVGAYVQICLEDLCYNPTETDENGVATFRLAQQDGYKTKLAMAVEGYVWEDYIYFASGETEITITLVAEE